VCSSRARSRSGYALIDNAFTPSRLLADDETNNRKIWEMRMLGTLKRNSRSSPQHVVMVLHGSARPNHRGRCQGPARTTRVMVCDNDLE
jgi:hypothetical protein